MKNRLFLGLSIFLIGSTLVGCGGGSSGPDAKVMEQARCFAGAMKKDINDFNGLIYESSFKENYRVAYASEDDDTSSSYSLSYHAEGDVLAGYALNVNGVEVSPSVIFNKGTGYFAGRQQETAKLSHVVTNKADQNKIKNTQADYALNHTFGIQFNGDELYASGKTTLTNKLVAANSSSGEFSGKIAKSALREFGESIIETAISRVLYLEAWSMISLFKEATIKYFQDLDLSTDDKANQFINEKQVKFTETDQSIQANFVLDGSKIIEELTGKGLGASVNVPGTAQINKQSKLVSYSDFDFKDFFLALLQKGSVNKTSFEVSVDACSLKTVLTSDSASQKKLDGTFTEYTDAQKAEFVTKFREYVVPALDNVEAEG